ncbi:MAG: ABC transporter permease [Candidatus Sumerlaeota bacterium]|nr:ABC transporter permease [Candidatus Sumerlaeota bacterium]
MATKPQTNASTCSIRWEESGPETASLTLTGRLDSYTIGSVWRQVDQRITFEGRPGAIIFDASALTYCDGAGIALILDLQVRQRRSKGQLDIRGLAPEYRALLNLFESDDKWRQADNRASFEWQTAEDVGAGTIQLLRDMRAILAFVGEMASHLAIAIVRPGSIRWKYTFQVMESAGVNALPIVALVGTLMGLIIGFQAAIVLGLFNAREYAGNMVALGTFRELGGLMTAIILAGRSGSAFAAEIGTMKINEEIDALRTMALDPARFLVVPRILAALVITPVLTVFADIFGIFGGALVMLMLGQPLVTYMNHVTMAITVGDFIGGVSKTVVYGLLVAGIGCLRGLRTGTGAQAVGESTTSAVVSGIILIVVADGIFAVVFYYLKI